MPSHGGAKSLNERGFVLKRLDVFLTVDTEVWPFARGWPVKPFLPEPGDLAAEVGVYLDGKSKDGEVGLAFQIETLRRHGLRATFFVEPFFADIAGEAVLKRVVRQLSDAGQDIGLHIHTEWLGEIKQAGLPGTFRQYIHQFSEDEQDAIIAGALARLQSAGANALVSYRAGSYAASCATLRVLSKHGIRVDTSFNACFPVSFPDLDKTTPFFDAAMIENMWELPVSFIEDRPNHRRHAQLNALSFAELRYALLQAWKLGWGSFVIVWHSSEFVKKGMHRDSIPASERLVLRRFKRLCAFLADEKEKFRVLGCSEFEPPVRVEVAARTKIRSPLFLTGLRMIEQGVGRIW